jgi:hypothetical protein
MSQEIFLCSYCKQTKESILISFTKLKNRRLEIVLSFRRVLELMGGGAGGESEWYVNIVK